MRELNYLINNPDVTKIDLERSIEVYVAYRVILMIYGKRFVFSSGKNIKTAIKQAYKFAIDYTEQESNKN